MNKKILALDIGGTFIKYGLIDTFYLMHKKGKVRNQLLTNGLEAFKGSLLRIYQKFSSNHEIVGIAISTFGIVDKANQTIAYINEERSVYLNFPFSSLFFNLPVYVENDANCALVGESQFGKLKTINDACMITLGTGIGAALMLNRQLYKGANNFAGEAGSMNYYGTTWEKKGSVKALMDAYKKLTNKKVSGKEILANVNKNQETHKLVMNWYKTLAYGIFNICTLFNPKTLLIGGGICACKEFDLQQIRFYLLKHTNNEALFPSDLLQVAKLGNDAALYGAVYLFLKHYGTTKKKEGSNE